MCICTSTVNQATRLYEQTAGDVFLVQTLLGHASAETTRAYVLVRNERLRAALEQLSAS